MRLVLLALAALLTAVSPPDLIAEVACPTPWPSRKIEGAEYTACLKDLLTKADTFQAEILRLRKKVEEIESKADEQTKAAASLRSETEGVEASYGYSFRFKGSEITAQRKPASRLYFYVPPHRDLRVRLYLATKKFPVNIAVDGKRIGRSYSDSFENLEISHQELKPETLSRAAFGSSAAGVPTLHEDVRPKGVHYIEFSPEGQFTFDENDDYEIAGVVMVIGKN
jgi:hypothetical protein